MAQQRRERREGLVRWVWLAGLVLLIMIAGDAFMLAAEGENVNLTVGRSMVLNTGSPIARVSLTSADVADAMVTSPNEVLINGKMPGTISMFVWDRAGAIRRYDVIVQRDIAGLGAQLKELFPEKRSTRRATANPSSSPASSPPRTSSSARSASPPATSTSATTSSRCCACRTSA